MYYSCHNNLWHCGGVIMWKTGLRRLDDQATASYHAYVAKLKSGYGATVPRQEISLVNPSQEVPCQTT